MAGPAAKRSSRPVRPLGPIAAPDSVEDALANGTANERGQARAVLTDSLDPLVVTSLIRSTATDGSGSPGRFEEPYGSEGWGFESLRARCSSPGECAVTARTRL